MSLFGLYYGDHAQVENHGLSNDDSCCAQQIEGRENPYTRYKRNNLLETLPILGYLVRPRVILEHFLNKLITKT